MDFAEYMLYDYLYLEDQSTLAAFGESRISSEDQGKRTIMHGMAVLDDTTQWTGVLGLGFMGNRIGNWTWDFYFEGDEVLLINYLMGDGLEEVYYDNIYDPPNRSYIITNGLTDGVHRKKNYWNSKFSLTYKNKYRLDFAQGQVFYEHAPLSGSLGEVVSSNRFRNTISLTLSPKNILDSSSIFSNIEEVKLNLVTQNTLTPRGIDFSQRIGLPKFYSFCILREGYSFFREISFIQGYFQSYFRYFPIAVESKWEQTTKSELEVQNTYLYYGFDIMAFLLGVTGSDMLNPQNVEDFGGLMFSFQIGMEKRKYSNELLDVVPNLVLTDDLVSRMLFHIDTGALMLYCDFGVNLTRLFDSEIDYTSPRVKVGMSLK